MEFYQDGTILIETGGMRGVGIGGAEGADIRIYRGKYIIHQNSDTGTGIGCVEGDIKLDVNSCDIDMTFLGGTGTGIGSLKGNADLGMSKTYFHCRAMADEYTAFGSCGGEKAAIRFKELGVDMDINAGTATGTGALKGCSEIIMDEVSYRYTGTGPKNYAFGGVEGKGSMDVKKSIIKTRVENETGKETLLSSGSAV